MNNEPNLKKQYKEEVVPSLVKSTGRKNVYSLPKIKKITVNAGMGEALTNNKAIGVMSETLATITGQAPVVTEAKTAVSNFKVKEGDKIGLKVTLRGDRMWYFLEKLIKIVLPRVRDFRGISKKSFDSAGNYSLGITEHTVFPEINPNKIDRLRGLGITIVTDAKNNEEALELLTQLGMPFKK